MLNFVLGSQSRVAVLRVLCRKEDLSGRQIASEAGLPSSSAKLALDELLATGVIVCSIHGARHGYQLNTYNHLLRPLRRLFAEESRTFSRLAAHIRHFMERNGIHSELRTLGLSRAGVLRIACADADPAFDLLHRKKLEEEIHSTFGLQLGPAADDATTIPTAERIWPDLAAADHEATTVSRLVDFLNPLPQSRPDPEEEQIP